MVRGTNQVLPGHFCCLRSTLRLLRTAAMTDLGERILRLSEVKAKVGLGHSVIYERMERGEFPRSFSIVGTKAKGWLLSEIDEWIRERAGRREAA
jgi:prophage regulatory protein